MGLFVECRKRLSIFFLRKTKSLNLNVQMDGLLSMKPPREICRHQIDTPVQSVDAHKLTMYF